MEYRRRIELDHDTEYWFVDMGALDHLNGAASYPFPTESAALRFAVNHKRIARESGVDRSVSIRYPNGEVLDVPSNPRT